MEKDICDGSTKVAIVGAGNVGSTAAYAMMIDGVASQIALIDINKDKAEGEALDLRHGMQFTKSAKILAGDSYELVEGAKVVIITAGLAQKPGGQTRHDLLEKNVKIFKTIIPQIIKHNKDCILLVVTNPLDVLTYVTWKLSGFPPCRVFGTGTVLDTARLRYFLGRHFGISSKDITAYILGEHGDSEFAWWSGANVAGMPLKNFERYSDDVMEKLYEEVKQAAYDVIDKKGATFYAIGLVIAKIIRAILTDQLRVMTVSSVLENYSGVDDSGIIPPVGGLNPPVVCMSVPTVVRRSGICQTLDISLDENEKLLFQNSAEKIAKAIDEAKRFL